MAADWKFDDAAVGSDLDGFATDGRRALAVARATLQAYQEKRPERADPQALREAAVQVTEARRRLREIDRDLLADAESLLEELLDRIDRPEAAAPRTAALGTGR